jgi:septal ring factor EnvC (AmiA/AmiB activator)
MLKTKRQTALDKATAEAPPVTTEQSSAELTAVISQLQAKRTAAEDRVAQIGEQRHRMLVDGAPDAAVDELRQEHRNLEVSVDDLQAAIRMAEARREAALVRERRESLEALSASLKSELLPALEEQYRTLHAALVALSEAATVIASKEAEIRRFNTRCTDAKRDDLKIHNVARQKVSDEISGHGEAEFAAPSRMSKESDDAYALRRSNAFARHGDTARRRDVFKTSSEPLIKRLLAISASVDRMTRRRLDAEFVTDPTTGETITRLHDGTHRQSNADAPIAHE